MKKIILAIFIFIFMWINPALSDDDWEWSDDGDSTPIVEKVDLYFFELKNNWTRWNQITTEKISWVVQEDIINNFTSKDVRVYLRYQKWFRSPEYFYKDFDKNTNGIVNLNVTTQDWKNISEKIRIIRINKQKPSWDIKYFPQNDVWTNSQKTATLEWSPAWNDWLVWNHEPSFSCDQEWWCSGVLQIQDSAWNTLSKEYNISNIDKTSPTIHTKKYALIQDWKQKIWYRCEDRWWSQCKNWTDEKIEFLNSGMSKIYCVEDNAWNISCQKITADNSSRDYSDDELAPTNQTRTLFLQCIDNVDWSWCTSPRTTKIISTNTVSTILRIEDNAWNSHEKVFQVSRIDKHKPNIRIQAPINNRFKASDSPRITIFFDDNVPPTKNDYQSGVWQAKYRWNNSCISWTNIVWTDISNGWNINYTVAWNHILYVCAKDNAGNINQINKNITIYPWDLDLSKSTIENIGNNNKYANFKDFYIYKIWLKDKFSNPIYSKKAINIQQKCDDSSCKTIYMDMIDQNINDDAISEYDFSWSSITNTNWKINFKIKSYAPWVFSNSFYFRLRDWNDSYNDIGPAKEYYIQKPWENSFLKPIEWNIKIIDWWDYPEIWKEQKYKINLINTWSLTNYNNWELKIEKTNISHQVDWHFWNEFKDEKWFFDNNISSNNIWFVWKIDANKNVLKWPQIKADNLELKYNLYGKGVRYFVNDIESDKSCDLETLWVKILWEVQWDGKSELTGQKQNFSDLYKTELRNIIRSNAYKNIFSMTNWQNINWVKYVEWDYSINNDSWYWFETLVIKDWNLIINSDVNIDDKKLWIIVLKDNYDVSKDYNNKWNIFINKDVEYISANLYSDWAIISANQYWNKYPDNQLDKQLKLYGNLFTRNTIWWAVLGWQNYTLPGWKTTNNYNLAEVYDLNYIRKVDNSCLTPTQDNYSFIIEYNSSIQTDPPKLFSK